MGILLFLLSIYQYVLIARVLFSWINPDPYHPVVRWVVMLTEPVLEPVRRVVPPLGGMDFSTLIVLVLIGMIRSFLGGGFVF